ncbi:MAG TPA: ABC transporter substrate-binding protein [Pusillimonas sp.]|jgi:putative ABC transport system substrate-binding protein|nr:ABC transporter substrate-binding protein [Pusillimonas sp.]HBT32570.1 ABC transporter substrate-binding protein [Pusillimonas sp.]HCN73152.1 ABC transporter substrate-binding protein [Pusillimonas sp.]HCP76224.1 ABC transporter substrate-binding protein [Pusillimonas sp.]|tara:strand:+ start:44239 stop:45207 length:969 start_codon:yes stop_codon:yes gene_type:complete
MIHLKIVRSLLGALLSVFAVMPVVAQAQSVAVTSIVEHPALDSIKDGVKAALENSGLTEEKGLNWQFQTAQGNTAIAAQIARKFVGDGPDVIVAIATPSAQAVVAATRDIPVVYSAVTDPVAAQLVESFEPSGTNVTGVSDMLDLERQIELIRAVVPNAKTVGMVYNPGEANSAVVVKQMREMLPAYGMTLMEASAPRTVDVGAAARSLIGNVDVIYTNTDNNVVSAYEALVKVGNDAQIPLVASDPDSVKRGAVAALGVNYYDLGLQTGAMVIDILNGADPGEMPSQLSEELELHVNLKAASQQGVTLSNDLIDSAAEVIR